MTAQELTGPIKVDERITIDTSIATGYRNVCTLGFDVDVEANAIVFDREQTVLSAIFQSNTQKISTSSSPVSIIDYYHSDDETIIVILDRAVPVESVSLLLSGEKFTFTLPKKQDPPEPENNNSSKQTSKKDNGDNDRDLIVGGKSLEQTKAHQKNRPQVEIRKDIAFEQIGVGSLMGHYPYTLELYRIDGDVVAEKPTITIPGASNYSGTGFIADRFAVRVKQGDVYQSLNDASVHELVTTIYPANPRIGIASFDADIKALKPTGFFWFDSEQLNAEEVSLSAGVELSEALQRYMDSIDELPSRIDVALVVESDEPCYFTLEAVNVSYSLLKKTVITFQGDVQEKQVIRFTGQSLTTHDLSFSLPALCAKINKAEINVDNSFSSQQKLAYGDALDSSLDSKGRALHLGEKYWMSQQCDFSDSALISGLVLCLTGIKKDTKLIVQFREDWENTPSGKVLHEANLSLPTINHNNWYRVPFPQSLQLSSGSYWVSVKAAIGEALWAVRQLEGNESARVLQMQESGSVLKIMNAVAQVKGLLAMLTPCSASEDIQVYSLIVNNAELSSSVQGSDMTTFDLTAVLATSGQTKLSFASMMPGMLTIYPAMIEYDVG